ncbi:hypothetical protein LAL4801_04175 [Roseibium aggregatum]|uniref:Uncharacterized protein n=1 Tax=Roseibium aggregatum TaxID=187304 RepID=A0A0M6YA84_9HYPH|nr:hypothetical protein LAL4801_04175 [Roseibium aggregatum]
MSIILSRKLDECPKDKDAIFLASEGGIFIGRLQDKLVWDEPYAFYYGANFGARVRAWAPIPTAQLRPGFLDKS